MSVWRYGLALVAIGAGTVLGGPGASAWRAPAGLAPSGAGPEPAPVTVIAGDGPADLYPGFDGGDVTIRLKNPNPYPMVFSSVTPGRIDSTDPAACPAASITVRAAGGLALFVAGDATSAPLTIPDVVSMSPDAPAGCQGAGFTIALTVGDGRAPAG
jgi:hypothetical protein